MRVLTILQGNKPVTYSQTVWLEAVDAAQIKENEEITLMYWGNVIVRRIHKTGDVVTSLYAGFPRTLRHAHTAYSHCMFANVLGDLYGALYLFGLLTLHTVVPASCTWRAT